MHFTDQSDYQVRFEWGECGLQALAAEGPCSFVIVDVLSFSTSVVVAVERGATIFPYRWMDDCASQYALEHGALLAGRQAGVDAAYSLSPESLLSVPQGTRLVLPSPNGSTLAFIAADRGLVLAGCLRNRSAVSSFLNQQQRPVAVIAAGERWPDRSLRPSFEDLVGAGAIVAGLSGSRSPEAECALATYAAAASRLRKLVMSCSSGRELVQRGYTRNVEIATEIDASTCVPVLRDACFTRADSEATA